MPPYIYDTANRVILAAQLWVASFDPSYGGTLMTLAKANTNKNVIYDHGGAAGSIMYNSGNDPTLASATGIAPNYIQQFRKEFKPRSLVKETEYSDSSYAVAGSIPYFWLSHEWFDDYIPDQVNRWQTVYNNIRPDLLQFAFSWNSPVYFVPSQGALSGSLFVGNENASYRGTPHSVYTSNFSLTSVIAFRGALISDSNVASIIATSEKKEGLRFDLNSRGIYAVYNRGSILFSGTVAPKRVNQDGLRVELELRGGVLSLFFDRQPVGSVNIGEAKIKREFGLQARLSSPIGLVEFGDRSFVDLDESVKVRNSVASDGSLQVDAEVTSFNPVFRTNLPQIFLDPPLIQRRVLILKNGARLYDNEIEDAQKVLINIDEVAAVYTGLGSGEAGLLAYDFKSDCNHLDGQKMKAHLIIGTNVIGINNLPIEANYNPVLMKGGTCRMSSKWLPYWDDSVINREVAR